MSTQAPGSGSANGDERAAARSHAPQAGENSLWTSGRAGLRTRPLGSDAEADVCVIGAGIAGLTTAYLLSREGLRVVVLDDGAVGGGETSRTTAHFVTGVDDRYYDLERIHGESGSRLVAQSHASALDTVEAIVARERIDCDFARLDGYLFVPPGESQDLLDRERTAARRAGLDVLEVARVPWTHYDTGRALVFPRQAQLHPLRYLAGLLRSIEAAGGRVHTGSHVASVEQGERARVITEAGPVVSARAVVVATNNSVLPGFTLHAKQVPYLTYVVGLRVPKGSVERALYWDTSESRGDPDPYHYLRTYVEPDGGEVLISGGADHQTGSSDDGTARYADVERWTRDRFPFAGETAWRWSGQVMEPADSLAFLGRHPGTKGEVFVVTGDSGNGMTHCTIGAMIVTDLIQHRANPWSKLYDPGRVPVAGVESMVEAGVGVLARAAEALTGGADGGEEGIEPGGGAVLRRGLDKIAVHRDEHGVVHRFSAVCPHLGCIVHWNGSAKTWDCPCHGSRFGARGKVVTGPANRDLDPCPD